MSVKWFGLGKFKHNVEETAKAVRTKLGNDILAATVKATPVDTGTLRNGWRFDHDPELGGRWVIHNPVEYAVHVEFGTPQQAARLMLTKSIQRVAARFPDMVRDAVRKGS